jgi:hypothetical protein
MGVKYLTPRAADTCLLDSPSRQARPNRCAPRLAGGFKRQWRRAGPSDRERARPYRRPLAG